MQSLKRIILNLAIESIHNLTGKYKNRFDKTEDTVNVEHVQK